MRAARLLLRQDPAMSNGRRSRAGEVGYIQSRRKRVAEADWSGHRADLFFDAHLSEDRLRNICEDRQVCHSMNGLLRADI
jgi:hypothetical protein